MNNKSIFFLFITIGLFFTDFSLCFAQGQIVSEIKTSTSAYTVKITSEKAMVSRDGSEAVPIANGTKLTMPGVYFLTQIDNNGLVTKIDTFKITNPKNTNSFTIKGEHELEEILKYALEDYKKEIVIQFKYGYFTIDALSDLFEEKINRVLNKYPKLVYEGYSLAAIEGVMPTVKLKFLYPLQITDNLKIYDAKADRALIKIINENVTSDMRDYKRELMLFKYIIDHVTYSRTSQERNISSVNATPMSHTMFGSLIDGQAVCDGYAKSMMYLLNAVGVPTQFVVGSTDDGILHAWNLVKIQGEYYHLDSTWGDQDEERIGALYEFFNEKDSYMMKTHSWDNKSYPKAASEAYSTIYMPVQLPDVYRIKKPSDTNKIFLELTKSSPQTATLVFYENTVNKWNEKEMTERIASSLRQDIIYSVDYKSNCLIISYKIT